MVGGRRGVGRRELGERLRGLTRLWSFGGCVEEVASNLRLEL